MDEKKVYTQEEMQALVKEYVTRNDDDINEAIREASLGAYRLGHTAHYACEHIHLFTCAVFTSSFAMKCSHARDPVLQARGLCLLNHACGSRIASVQL